MSPAVESPLDPDGLAQLLAGARRLHDAAAGEGGDEALARRLSASVLRPLATLPTDGAAPAARGGEAHSLPELARLATRLRMGPAAPPQLL